MALNFKILGIVKFGGKMKAKKQIDIWIFVSLTILALYVIFLIYPMFNVAKTSVINSNGNFTLEYFIRFFSQKYYLDTLKNSFIVSFATTIISLAVGVPLAYLYNMFQIRGRKFLQIVIILCTMSAPFIGAYSWILLLGRNGVITVFFKNFGIEFGTIYGFKGILLSMASRLFPLAFMYVSGAMQNIDNSLFEASANLGCSGVSRFLQVGVPLCMPSVLAAALMIFMRAFADFGTPLMIGEGYRTFPVEIYNQFVGETGTNYNFAAAISVIAIVITAIVFFVQKFANSRFQFTMSALHPIERKKAKPVTSFFIHLYAYGVVSISMMPQIYLIYTSFRKSSRSGFAFVPGYSFGNYISAFKRMNSEVWNTVYIGVATLLVIILFAILVAYLVVRRKSILNNTIDTFSMLPYIIPGSVVGIALATSFSTSIIPLTGTAIIMIIAMCIRRIPYTIRSSVATLQQIPMNIEEAAISLGATKAKTFMAITVPMMGSGIIAGAILSWVSIITELSSSIMLYSAGTTTLTVMVYSLVNRGTYGQAAAVATILTVFTIISLMLFNKFSKSGDISL